MAMKDSAPARSLLSPLAWAARRAPTRRLWATVWAPLSKWSEARRLRDIVINAGGHRKLRLIQPEPVLDITVTNMHEIAHFRSNQINRTQMRVPRWGITGFPLYACSRCRYTDGPLSRLHGEIVTRGFTIRPGGMCWGSRKFHLMWTAA